MFSLPSIRSLLCTICTVLSFTPTVFADDAYWSENIFPENGYFVIPKGEFDFFSLETQEQTPISIQRGEQWRGLTFEDNSTEMITVARQSNTVFRIDTPDIPEYITVHFARIDSKSSPSLPIASTSIALEGVPIFSRKDWGANESLRYREEKIKHKSNTQKDTASTLPKKKNHCQILQENNPDEFETTGTQYTENGKYLRWPYSYSKKVRKIVLHHTAESGVENGKTATQVMRGIYWHHAVVRGWGDIGYHYVIAPNGNIFEGRAGGTSVVGGHAYCHNIGSIGVSLMGNFTNSSPTPAQLHSLESLLPKLAKIYDIDLSESESFHDKYTPNLIGHRDLTATACPGENMYSLLDTLRQDLLKTQEITYIKSQKADGKPESSAPILSLKPGESQEITLAFVNTGERAWSRNTWLFLQQGKGISVHSISPTKKYVVAKQKERTVEPGETAHFTVRLQAEYSPGIFSLSFTPVVGDKRLKNAETLQVIEVLSPEWKGEKVSVTPAKGNIFTNTQHPVTVRVKNTGKTRWNSKFISLLAKNPFRQKTVLSLKKNTWQGQTALFEGFLPASVLSGKQRISFHVQNESEITPIHFSENITVLPAQNTARITPALPRLLRLQKGTEEKKKIRIKNTGNIPWTKQNITLQIQNKRNIQVFSPQEEHIAPGEYATFFPTFSAGKGITPYIISFKYTTKRLLTKVLLIRASSQMTQKKSLQSSFTNTRPLPPVLHTKSQDTEKQKFTDFPLRIRLSVPDTLRSLQIIGTSDVDIIGQNAQEKKKKNTPLLLRSNGKIISVNGVSGSILRIQPREENGILQIANWSRIPAWDTQKSWNDNQFFGTLEFRIDSEGNFLVINELPLETYLLGVAETTESSPPEKKKAIAILSRSYASFYQDAQNRKFPKQPYDGSDNPNAFQKYLGASLTQRSPLWVSTVKSTENQILTYHGRSIKPPYHTSSGGKTISAQEKWGWKDAPYLQSTNDPGCINIPRSGHGVGMSGCGARYMAEQGKTYQEILEYYFPGTQISVRK